MKKGIDVSHHQGVIDFEEVKKAGLDFVIIREGYGAKTDNFFFQNVEGFKKAGIPILGVYHFAYPLTIPQDAVREAEFCLSNVKKAGLPANTICFYDFEYDTVKKANALGHFFGTKECIKSTESFCQRIYDGGYTPGFYTNLDYWKHYYKKEKPNKAIIMWLADYNGKPDVPCPFQQYTNSGVVPGIKGPVDHDYFFEEEFKMNDFSRKKVVELVESWDGKKVSDGSYKEIIDIYNTYSPLPRGIRMQYGWAWCACTWSALAIKLGYTSVMPIEISCGNLIEEAKKMGCWQEADNYIPAPGDAVLYDWDDSGKGDNTSWPDHVGTVIYCNEAAGYFTVEEGNYGKAVKKRTVSINGKYIRGFITPKYAFNEEAPVYLQPAKDNKTIAHEIISGMWGNGVDRKNKLEAAGYEYAVIQYMVTQILNGSAVTGTDTTPEQPVSKKVECTCKAGKKDTTLTGTYETITDLYCRNDAGKNKRALCLIPKGTKVKNYGFYSMSGSAKWYLIQFTMDGVQYTGFSSSTYLRKVG